MRHSFSVQMSSAESISGLVINRKKDRVFIEGELGQLKEAEYVEGKVLTITGENGVLRIDICRETLLGALNPKGKHPKPIMQYI
ncbi:hypothetical protein KAI10_00280 [Candidatus Bathyarchaeota archaeon]|nr:hypothetical protein [Candidatus Bathyarchaeota archaeon]